MPTFNLYRLDGKDLESANSIFTDAEMSIVAPDGWYAADGFSRQMLNGVLLPPAKCAPCPGAPGGVNYNLAYGVQNFLPEGSVSSVSFSVDVNGVNEISLGEVGVGTELVSSGSTLITFSIVYEDSIEPLDQITLRIESPGGVVISENVIDSPVSDLYTVTASGVIEGDTSIVAKITGF